MNVIAGVKARLRRGGNDKGTRLPYGAYFQCGSHKAMGGAILLVLLCGLCA